MRRLHALMLAGLVLAAAGAVELAGLEPSRRDPEPMEIRSRLAALLHRPDVAAGLEPGIRAALDADDPETAEEYREAAGLAGLPVDPDLEARYREATTPARTALRTARQATAGFVSGEAQGAAGTMGVFAADLVGIGDVRDLAGEARHLIDGAPVDRLTLGLSVLGIGLTVGTVASLGAAEPAKAGVALANEARLARALTRGFERSLGTIAVESVDLAAWRRAVAGIPWWRADRLAAETAALARTARTDRLAGVAASLGEIRAATSARRTLGLLRHVESVEDLNRVETLARAAGKPVSGAFRLAGRRTFTVLGKVAVQSARIAGSALLVVAGLLLSGVSALLSLILGGLLGMAAGALARLATGSLRALWRLLWRLPGRPAAAAISRTPPAPATAARCSGAPPG